MQSRIILVVTTVAAYVGVSLFPAVPPLVDDAHVRTIMLMRRSPSGVRSNIGAFIVENECPPALLLSVWQMRTLLPDLQVQILHTGKNAEWLANIYAEDPNVKLTPLPEPYRTGGFDRDIYSAALTDPRVWRQITFSRALQFQKDTWLCAGEGKGTNMLPRLRHFFSYDLVAAPWDWPKALHVAGWAKTRSASKWLRELDGCHGVGNGGFRLLNISAMHLISRLHGPINTSYRDGKILDSRPEDIFFCQHLGTLPGARVANASVARGFGVEGLAPIGRPIGAHRPWKHWQPWSDSAFRAGCPGLELLRIGQGAPSTCSSHATGAKLVEYASARYNTSHKMAALDQRPANCTLKAEEALLCELRALTQSRHHWLVDRFIDRFG